MLNQTIVREATRLTQAGRLAEATALLQQHAARRQRRGTSIRRLSSDGAGTARSRRPSIWRPMSSRSASISAAPDATAKAAAGRCSDARTDPPRVTA